jgi:hypothetical protein
MDLDWAMEKQPPQVARRFVRLLGWMWKWKLYLAQMAFQLSASKIAQELEARLL